MKYMELSEIAEIFVGIRASRYEDKINGKTKKILENSKKHGMKIECEDIKMGEYNPKFDSQTNDIIIHLMDPSRVDIIKREGILIPSSYAIVRLKTGYDADYIYQILKTRDFKQLTYKMREGTRIKFIKINDLKSIKIKIPRYDEQKIYGRLMYLMYRRKVLDERKIELEEEFLHGMIKEELGGHYVKL